MWLRPSELGVGRLGVYVRPRTFGSEVVIRELAATTDPTTASNFSLLYATPGYDVAGPKRLLVRTLNDVDPSDLDLGGCSFTVKDGTGTAVFEPRQFGPPTGTRLTRAFGFQVLEGDFTDLHQTAPSRSRSSL